MLTTVTISGMTMAKSIVPVEKIQDVITPVTTQVQSINGQSTVVSPRTGIQYTIPNEQQRPVVLQTQAIAAANAVNAQRIVAKNPALSPESQQIATQALIDLSK